MAYTEELRKAARKIEKAARDVREVHNNMGLTSKNVSEALGLLRRAEALLLEEVQP